MVASDVRIGVRAFRDWCWGLGLPYIKPQSRVRRNYSCLGHTVGCLELDALHCAAEAGACVGLGLIHLV